MRSFIILIGLIFIFSCKKDPAEPVDCLGVSGGSAKIDNCETCDADPANDCVDCISHLAFNISLSQAFYYFNSVTINGITLDPTDWVGAFNGDICVGARQWDISQCGGGTCDLPAMGDVKPFNHTLGDPYATEGYMQFGDIPVFKIYDVSEGMIYNTKTTEEIVPWSDLKIQVISTLESTTAAPCQ